MSKALTFNNNEEKQFWDKCFTAALMGSNSFKAEAEADAALRARRVRIDPIGAALRNNSSDE